MPMPMTSSSSTQSTAPASLVSFARSADEHYEGPFLDVSNVLTTTGTISLSPVSIPAYGYLRAVWVQVDATGGTGAAAVANEDAPFTAINSISITDTNSAPIVGPISGYDAYLIHKYGGYRNSIDPKQNPAQFSAVAATGNFKFIVRIPIEQVMRDGLGSLPNANAASSYRVNITLASGASGGGLYNTAPTTQPTVRVRLFLEAWTQPDAVDLFGNAQTQAPPANGTTSFWSKQPYNVPSGTATTQLTRVGNYLRNLILVARAVSDGTRGTGETLFPDPIQLNYDTKPLYVFGKQLFGTEVYSWFDLTAANDAAKGRDNGVYVFPWTRDFDLVPGAELRNQLLPTVQSTRLELQGSWGAAVTLSVLTNDVSPAGNVFTS